MRPDTSADLSRVIVSESVPVVLDVPGRLWFRPSSKQMHVWYDHQWRHVGGHRHGYPSTGKSWNGSTAYVSEHHPEGIDLGSGDLWYNPTKDRISILFENAWVYIRFFQ